MTKILFSTISSLLSNKNEISLEAAIIIIIRIFLSSTLYLLHTSSRGCHDVPCKKERKKVKITSDKLTSAQRLDHLVFQPGHPLLVAQPLLWPWVPRSVLHPILRRLLLLFVSLLKAAFILASLGSLFASAVFRLFSVPLALLSRLPCSLFLSLNIHCASGLSHMFLL